MSGDSSNAPGAQTSFTDLENKFRLSICVQRQLLTTSRRRSIHEFPQLACYFPIKNPDVPMMFRGTKPRSPRGPSRVNVETIGGRSPRHGLPRSRPGNQNGAGLSDNKHGALQNEHYRPLWSLPGDLSPRQTGVVVSQSCRAGQPGEDAASAANPDDSARLLF
jgi:hypothetical protein